MDDPGVLEKRQDDLLRKLKGLDSKVKVMRRNLGLSENIAVKKVRFLSKECFMQIRNLESYGIEIVMDYSNFGGRSKFFYRIPKEAYL